jgi:hypothetical protein
MPTPEESISEIPVEVSPLTSETEESTIETGALLPMESVPETVVPAQEPVLAPTPLPVEEVSISDASSPAPTPLVPDFAAPIEPAQSTSTSATPPAPTHLGGSTEEMRILTHIAAAARKRQAEEHIEQVMGMARKNGKVDNVTVRLTLRISRTTATRYLTELVRQGRLTHHRKGNDVVYEVRG